ncbi:ABC transporter ATP-binding protein [Advenella mimigardefordensis]|uniref:Putative ABC transporter ATP-binding protein n=1 Tax=Advenella mimigardefordensis (strain DSM 17166 / LMG 22922 / DPN7) TaxID=1247726 RepID=W0PLC9_ADVMD|nr:ATP-binding cassette domain-containing protein [Advenella mimigardefordensis]AHG65783.1 putative ABC transporter ATP-binding protein [Advenella mimigardefordensis DPN7]
MVTENSEVKAPALLQASNLSRKDPLNGHFLLHPADCHIRRGDRIVLSGASGSGKSVFVRTLALLDQPDAGELILYGKPVQPADACRYRAQVAYIRQSPVLMQTSVEGNLTFPFCLAVNKNKKYDRQKIERFLQAIDRPNTFLDKDGSTLSGGEKQLVCLLRVLQLDPCLLLLDEPTSALDESTAQLVEKLIEHWMQVNKQQTATLWISHDEQQKARVGNRVWQMKSGQLTTDETAGRQK